MRYFRCPICGYSQEASDRFCGGCGTAVSTTASQDPPPKTSELQVKRRSKYSIYNDICAGRSIIQPEFIAQGDVSRQTYLTFLGLTLNAGSVINGNPYISFSLDHEHSERDVWRRLPPIRPHSGTRFIEVEPVLDTVNLTATGGIGAESWMSAGWGAIVTDMAPTSANLSQGWVPRGTETILCIDLCVRRGQDHPVQLPVAQYVVPLDVKGKPLKIIGSGLSTCWGATIFCSTEQTLQIQNLVRHAIFPTLLALAEENGVMPKDLRPKSTSTVFSKFAIRQAVLDGRFTCLDRRPNEPSPIENSEILDFVNQVANSSFYDASNGARVYLLEELEPNYDWSLLPSLIPPEPSVYIEVEPPDLFLNESGIIRPFSVLEGAGVRWSALVQHAQSALDRKLYITLNVQDDEGSAPRGRAAFTVVSLEQSGRAASESGMTWLTGAFAKRDHPNIPMWLQPIMRRLVAFSS